MNINLPYRDLGTKLKQMRVSIKETLAEVSGAVEIDLKDLAIYERGENRPSEDILLLLISHFGVKEDEATDLWELAGYDDIIKPKSNYSTNMNDAASQQRAFVSQGDIRVVYTDMVHVMVNNYGVVMNFMQGMGNTSQPFIISRVGMSKEHARSVIEVLQKTLEASELSQSPKLLPEKTDQV